MWWLDRREFMAAWRERVRHWWIRGRVGRFGHELVGTLSFGGLQPAGIAGQEASGRCPSVGQNRGGEIRETEGERKGPVFKLIFLKILNKKSKNFEHKSCREFENLQLLFRNNVHLSFSLEVIFNLRLLGFEFLFISCVLKFEFRNGVCSTLYKVKYECAFILHFSLKVEHERL
jgi:hypothetical protein